MENQVETIKYTPEKAKQNALAKLDLIRKWQEFRRKAVYKLQADYDFVKLHGKNFIKLSKKQQDDIIAEKIMQKIKDGQLITNPDDSRRFNGFFEKVFNNTADLSGKTTGQAASINQQQTGLFGYTNPLTSSNHIYTREEVGQMSSDEFAKHEKEIDAQTRAFNGAMPTNGDLQREAMTGGGAVYVNSYTRSDGTEVKGYYRSRPSI